jgi:hypothetical protein
MEGLTCSLLDFVSDAVALTSSNVNISMYWIGFMLFVIIDTERRRSQAPPALHLGPDRPAAS